ncbi:MAG: sugar phosphate isomerase/epimerase family protein [Limnohabitans sp.]
MRTYSLAYLTANASTVPQAVRIAAELGYAYVGLRVQPNGPGAPYQALIGDAAVLRETQAVMRDTDVGVYDLEIIRIGEQFKVADYAALMGIGQTLGAKAVLIAADDTHEPRLADNYAHLCEVMRPYGLTADLEFMPWTAVKDAKSALRVIEMAGRPSNAGILVDALHFGRSTTTLQDIADIPHALLHYAQMCDAQAGLNFTTEELIHTARQERLLPGEGNIDVGGLFAALPQDLPVSVEIVNLERSAPIGDKAWAALCLDATKKALGDA